MTLKNLAALIALAGAVAGLVLMAARFGGAVSFSEPLQLYTSGAEQGPLFAVWRHIHDTVVYLDPHQIPFAPTYYNWLFFELYGWAVRVILATLGLAEPWLPTITRLITLGAAIAGAVMAYRSLRLFASPPDGGLKIIGLSLAIYLFFGPLAGFWSITTHPEIIANVFLMASIHVFVRHYDDRPFKAVLLFCLFAYVAWGFKQSYVFSPGAVGLWLLIQRDWRMLLVLVVVLPLAWAVTFLIGSDTYATVILFRDTDVTFAWGTFSHNFANVTVKTLPVTFGLAVLVVVVTRAGRLREIFLTGTGACVFALGGLVSIAMVLPLSAKVGAAENYYLPVTYFLAGSFYLALCRTASDSGGSALTQPALAAMSVGWIGVICAIGLVLGGVLGVVSSRHWHDKITEMKRCLDPLPGPLFTPARYNLLPWMNPNAPHFVFSYEYFKDRAAGRKFERGGIGGLIGEGYFATLFVEASDARFDGARLADGYKLSGKCAGFQIWRRRDPR